VEQVVDGILNLLNGVVKVVVVLLVVLRPIGRLLQIEDALTRLSETRLEGTRAGNDGLLVLVGKVEAPARAGC
jgi:hypothetical protein